MRKLTNLFLAATITMMAAVILSFSVGNTEAGKRCTAQSTDSACEVWKRQQNAPALTGPKKPSEPVRCVAVLADQPAALVLRVGLSTKGSPVTSWRRATLNWNQTNRGFETTICFPKRYTLEYDSLTLCGAIGHSKWRPQHMAVLRQRNVGSNDPACVGGNDFCAQFGL